jgi:Kef-type K+ transport system membrane component KefB
MAPPCTLLFSGSGVQPLLLLLLQVVTILAVTHACGFLLERLGQPRVVGEITGGLLLGPLVFGHLFPSASAFLFQPSRLHPLEVVSNIGLVLFLLLIGAEVDLAAAGRNRGASLAITIGSIAVPFALGAGLSPFLQARFGMPGVPRLGFLLFTGIAMSITALPVLARIIQERSRTASPIDAVTASTALLCAAANDLLAWSLLAIALTLIHSGQGDYDLRSTALRLLVLAGYIALLFFAARPLAARFFDSKAGTPRRWLPAWLWLPGVVAVAFLSARITEMLGVHAFFGAFLAGVCVPRIPHGDRPLKDALERTLQPIIRVTLPIFFAMTGLRTQPEMFSSLGLGWLGIVLMVAVAGKIGGAIFAARASGMAWKMSTQVGILLNTRGLVELVVLNVGYKEGILSPLLFTLFVLMAIITTAMTVPLFQLSHRLIPAHW